MVVAVRPSRERRIRKQHLVEVGDRLAEGDGFRNGVPIAQMEIVAPNLAEAETGALVPITIKAVGAVLVGSFRMKKKAGMMEMTVAS